MANKTLKSIKFPNLPDTYTIIQDAPEYDPEKYYHHGEICIYQGVLYMCVYQPETEYDTEDIQGIAPDDPEKGYWEALKYLTAELLEQQLQSWFRPIFDPANCYARGFVVSHNGTYYICIKDTPDPVGSFQESYSQGYWIHWGSTFEDPPTTPSLIESLENTSNFIQSLIPELNIEEAIEASSLSWEKVNEDVEESSCDFAVATFNAEEGYDYLISCEVIPMIEGSSIGLYYQIYNGDKISPSYPAIDSNWNSFSNYRTDFGPFDHGELSYVRIRNSIEHSVGQIGIAIQSNERAWDDEGELYLDSFRPITDKELNEWISEIRIFKIKKSGDVNLSEVTKLVLQDYTEVYKDLSTDIFQQNTLKLSSDFRDSVPIPLNEGNIALQFINLPIESEISWKKIDIEIRLYSNKFGATESINLTDDDKHIFIVNENMQNNGDLIEWDYFKLRFRSKVNELISNDELNFINSSFNILRKPKTQSNPNPIRRNSPEAVKEFINLARSFVKAEDLYVVNQPTFLETYCHYNDKIDNFNIDAATFINAALRGLSFDNTPYSANWTLPNYDQYTYEQPEVVSQ